MLSDCCRKEMTVDYGEEGTNCFICSSCQLPCNIYVPDPIAEAIANTKLKLAVLLQKVVDWLKV